VFSIGTISNNNLQDLKTGQLVGATPRAQQWALIIGVLAGAAVIPPVLNLLNQASGFAGAPHLATQVYLVPPILLDTSGCRRSTSAPVAECRRLR